MCTLFKAMSFCVSCRGPVPYTRDEQRLLVPDRYCSPACRAKDKPRSLKMQQEAKERRELADEWARREADHLHRITKQLQSDGDAGDIHDRLALVSRRDTGVMPQGDLRDALRDQQLRHTSEWSMLHIADREEEEKGEVEEKEDDWMLVKVRK
jgi:hypothetical protein